MNRARRVRLWTPGNLVQCFVDFITCCNPPRFFEYINSAVDIGLESLRAARDDLSRYLTLK